VKISDRQLEIVAGVLISLSFLPLTFSVFAHIMAAVTK
jgi:hypothetical protein